jgi:hypothetical protein
MKKIVVDCGEDKIPKPMQKDKRMRFDGSF